MSNVTVGIGDGGLKADRGTSLPTETSNVDDHRPHPGARGLDQRRAM
jgi:hypothetical protein